MRIFTVVGILLLAAFSGYGQTTLYLRHGLPVGGIQITGCSNTTPVTVTYASDHGLAVDDYVHINSQRGNTACNGTHRVKTVPTTTQITLKTIAGADVVGNGTWISSNQNHIGGKVVPVTTKAGPLGYFDGFGGSYLRSLRCAIDTADACLTQISVASNIATATTVSGYSTDLTAGVSKLGVWNTGVTNLNGTYTVTGKTATTITFATSGVSDGTYTTAHSAISKLAFAGNVGWDRAVLTTDSWSFVDQPGQDSVYGGGGDSGWQRVVTAALVWYVRRDANALTRAKYGVHRIEDLVLGTVACNPAVEYCGANFEFRGNTLDFTRGNLQIAALAARLIWDELTSGERTTFLNKLFDNKDAGCTLPTWTTGTGSISITGTTATGAGLTSLAVGDVLLLETGDAENNYYRIVAAGNPATLDRGTTFSGTNWKWAVTWAPGQCGLVEYTKYHRNSPFGSAERYGPTAGGLSLTIHSQNLYFTGGVGYWMTGIILADKDTRAARLAEEAWAYLYDYPLAFARARWTGYTQAGPIYGDNRSPFFAAESIRAVNIGTTGYPEDLGGDWLKQFINWKVYGRSPHAGASGVTRYNTLFGEGTHAPESNNLGSGYRAFMPTFDSSVECGWYRDYANAMAGGTITSGYVATDAGRHGYKYLLGFNPNGCVATLPTITAKIFNTTAHAACVASGMKACGASNPNSNLSFAISRTGFAINGNDTLVVGAAPIAPVDHDSADAGSVYISKGVAGGDTPCLVGGDSAACNGHAGFFDAKKYSTLDLGTRTVAEGNMNAPGAYIDWGAVDGASNRYAAWRMNLAQSFTSPAPTRARRWMAHFKTASEILFIVDDVATPSATTVNSFTHFTQNGQSGEGTTTCDGGCSTSSIASGRVVSQSLLNTLVSQWYFPTAGHAVRVENLSGTYTGGAGFTFRTTAGSTSAVTASEIVQVVKVLSGTGSTALTSTSLTPTGFMGAEADGHVALFPRAGGTPTSATFSKAATGDVLVGGLAAGTYRLTLGGTPVCTGVVVTSTTPFYCPAVASGSVVVEVAPTSNTWYVSPSVTGTTGDGTIGNPCGLAAVLEGNCSTSPAIAAGDTIYLRAGIHLIGRYGFGLTNWRETSLAGTSGNPITFRSYPGEWARVDGGIIFNGSDIIWRDTEVFCSLTDKQSAENGSFPTDMWCPAALSAKAPRIKFINNVVRNSGEIALWDTAPNSEAYGNLNYYGGWRALNGNGHGHGFYIQNNTGQHRVEANIVHTPFGQGVQVYGTIASNLNNVFFDNNVWFRGGFANSNAGVPVPTRNFLIGGAVNAADMTVRHNYSFDGEVNLGYNGGSGQGCSNMEYSNSYHVSPNTISYAINIADGVGGDLTCNFNGATTGNTRYGDPNGATLPGTNRTLTSGTLPGVAEVFVTPNIYETGRANIVAWNWPNAATVSADVSTIGLVTGDTFAIRDSQNYFGTPALVGTYVGAVLNVPMTSTTVETPIWTDPAPAITHTSSQFNAFIIVKTGVTTVNITTTTLPNGTQGSAYSQALAADNCSPCVWTVSSGTLPPGLTLSSGGTISGTPTTVGSFSVTPQATVAATGALDITPPSIGITISAPTSAPFKVNLRGVVGVRQNVVLR